MFFLLAPLLFIGFYGVTADSEKKKLNEHLISLRDYDFVGEDQRLSALLAERMAVLRAPLNVTKPEPGGPLPEPAASWPWSPSPSQLKPDYLHSNVKFPQVVNVSLDYAELINESDWLHEMMALDPEIGGAPAPRPGGAAAPAYGRAPTPGNGRAPASGIGRAPTPSFDAQLGHVDGRRNIYKDPKMIHYNTKLLEMMKQCVYSTQGKITELEPYVSQFERDPRFRMAFIIRRLDEWYYDMRTVLWSMIRWRRYRRRAKITIWYYENMLRLNIDITYSIEHMMYLHDEYIKFVERLMPKNKRMQLDKMKRDQRKAEIMKKLGLTTKSPKPKG